MSKKKKNILGDFYLQPLWAVLAGIGLIGAAMGTTYTNYDTLSHRFPEVICLSVCISITLSFSLPMFLKKIPIIIRVSLVFMMFVSSSLAINTFAAKEIVDAEDRFKDDEKYRSLKLDYLTKTNQYQKAWDANIANASKGYATGAREARLDRDQLKTDKDLAYQKLIEYADSLKIKGSITQEASVETWYTVSSSIPIPYFKRLSKAFWAVFSVITFAYICDTAIPIFCYILYNILGDRVLIENRKRLDRSSVNKKLSSVFSRFSKRFSGNSSKGNRKKQGGRTISGEKFNGVQAIFRLKDEHPDWTHKKIGEHAAVAINRKGSDGKIKPFQKSWISQVLNNKF